MSTGSLDRGKTLYEDGKIDEAITQLQIAQKTPALAAEAGFWLGQAYGIKKKLYAPAVKTLEAARSDLVAENELWKNITYLLARLHEAAKKTDLALAEYAKLRDT